MTLAKELPSGRIARKHKEEKVFSIYGADGVTLVAVLAYEDVVSLAESIEFIKLQSKHAAEREIRVNCNHPEKERIHYHGYTVCDQCGEHL